MKTIIVLGALLAATTVHAQTTTINRYNGQTTITTRPYITYEPRPSIVYVPRATAEEIEASRTREAAWLIRCKPVLTSPDANGVRRYSYAAPGCEFGD